MRWTQIQTEAIERPGSLLVAAAAGSGKTAVLTERIVRLIREGAEVNEFLVVTFTRAAAGEMKKRIGKRLFEAAAEADETASARLYLAASGIGQATISTLHSFCSQVLRRHFHMANIDPGFRIADDTEIALMREDALDELFEERLLADDMAFKDLLAMFHPQDALRGALLHTHAFMYSRPDPFSWLENAVGSYRTTEDELISLPHAKVLFEESRRAFEAELSEYARARDDIPEAFQPLIEKIDSDLLRLRSVLLCADLGSYAEALLSMEFSRLTFQKVVPDDVRLPLKERREAMSKLVKRQCVSCAFDAKKEAARMAYVAKCTETLVSVLHEFAARMAEKKAEARLVDYNDLEHLTLRLFQNESIAAEYREKFKYIFVDEYQDSNAVQESILQSISKSDNLFFVGDVKQSIYRFRLAEPGIFLEKYAHYGIGAGGTLVDLNANFRSAKNVVDTVNAVFSQIMSREGAEIDYDERAALTYGRGDGEAGGAELLLIERGRPMSPIYGESGEEDAEEAEETAEEGEELDEDLSELADAELEARAAAARILELKSTMLVTDAKTGEQRALRYDDIAVLHRSARKAAEAWVETLSSCGVPAYAEVKGGYFEAVEVQVFLDLLRVLDNRRQDIPLAAVLRSPIGGFSTEELIALRAQHKAGMLFDALCAAQEYDTPLEKKTRAFFEQIARWHEDSLFYGLEELLFRLFDQTGYYEYVSALPGGDARRKNLDALADMARAYEKNGARGLSGFLAFMDRAKSSDSIGAAQTAGVDVVRVMTIHAAKGLEFPVVILAGMSKHFNMRDTQGDIVLDAKLGIGFKPVMGGVRVQTLCYRGVRAKLRFLGVAEEMRVLYVAMTRARDRLIMLATVKNTEKEFLRAAFPITPARAASASRFLDWLLPALYNTPGANALRVAMGASLLPGETFCTIGFPRPDGSAAERAHTDEGAYRKFMMRAKEADVSPFERLLSWRYPFLEATALPSKVSVTGLSAQLPPLRELPDFMLEKTATPAGRGTATHVLMEHISLKAHTAQSAREELLSLMEKGLLTREEAQAVNAPQVAAFFSSPLGKRLIGAEICERELEFNCRLKASELFPTQSEELLLLQGVIDCCFLENGAWVLLDYKTDFIAPDASLTDAAQKHARQISLYARALEQLTGKPVKEKYVHFLRTGNSVSV